MKKLYIAGIISISLLTYSCSNDEDSYEVQGAKSKDSRIAPQSVLKGGLNAKAIDTTAINTPNGAEGNTSPDGDPINPRPPR
ncbi:hypothetical protein [Flavobacterium aestivum]|uniref:hypothetical protein n=1 Tax=Flavobacterium aestivum TaxID=3003257 RepID=UPI0022866E8A|nr:hypothetical protein [Flavobacterium aestivum]